MASSAELQAFLTRVRRHGDRMDQIAARPQSDVQEMLLTALAELEMLYEDLLVANDELRVQGEELTAIRGQLAASQARYQELFDAAPVASLVTTLTGTILEANLAADGLLGNPPGRGVGTPIEAFIAVDCRPAVRRLLLAVSRDTGTAAVAAEVVPRHRRPMPARLVVNHQRPNGLASEATLRWTVTVLGPGTAASGPGPA